MQTKILFCHREKLLKSLSNKKRFQPLEGKMENVFCSGTESYLYCPSAIFHLIKFNLYEYYFSTHTATVNISNQKNLSSVFLHTSFFPRWDFILFKVNEEPVNMVTKTKGGSAFVFDYTSLLEMNFKIFLKNG